MVVVGID